MTTPIASAGAPPPVAAAANGAAPTPELAKLRKVAQQFEAVFLRQMIGAMRAASPGDGALDSSASLQFRDMSDARMADQMAGKNALGVADLLVRQLGARLVGPAAAASGSAAAAAASPPAAAAAASPPAAAAAASGPAAAAAASGSSAAASGVPAAPAAAAAIGRSGR